MLKLSKSRVRRVWKSVEDFIVWTLAPWIIALPISITIFKTIADIIPEPRRSPETLDVRIEKLSKSLLSASKTVSEIELEIDKRKKLVARLQSDAATAQNLKDLNAAQIAAVSQALRGQIEAESRAHYWRDILVSAGVGVALGNLSSWATKKLRALYRLRMRSAAADE